MNSQTYIPVPGPILKTINLLVVDDEKEICNLIKSSLAELDDRYAIEIAHSAPQALKHLLQNHCDVLITDIKMPRMDGMQLLKSVKRLYDNTSIIIMTAHGNLDTAIEAIRIGAANYLEKPISVKLLHHTVQEIINKRAIFQRLQESEERFRTVFHSTPDAIFIAGHKDKRLVSVNRSFTELMGYENFEVEGKTFESFDPWFDPDEASDFYLQLENKLLVSNFRAKFRARDDRVFTGLVSARVVSLDFTPHDVIVIRDVSELELAITALDESEGRYSRIFQNIQDAYFEIKPDGTLLEISPSVENILFYKREELLGRPEYKIWANQAELYGIVSNIKKTKKLKDCEIQLWRKDGVLLTCSINAIMVDADSESDIRIIGSMRDISELKKIQQQLINNQKLETISRLAGGIAHDFNNMLTGIMGYADLARNMVKKEDTIYSYMQAILEKSNEATELVEHLMAFSSSRKLEMRVLNLNELLMPLSDFLKKTVRSNIKFTINLKPHLDVILADYHSLQQAITNICLNSESAMPDGGKIEIRSDTITVADDDSLQRQGIKPGRYILLSISDTGIGIQKEDLSRIFDPYFTTRKIGEGSGLGLSAVYGLIRQHGGYLTCDSKPNKKTTFKLFFPVYEYQEPERAKSPPEPVSPKNKTVLVVEDDKSVITVVRKLLEREHFEVIIAVNGKEALDKLHEVEKINIIISDVVMPEMSGDELYRRVREAQFDCKFIFISGYDRQQLEKEEFEGVQYLQKPFNSSQLLEAIANLYRQKWRGGAAD
ncbi:MAG: response regulator [FCB group bacterium]|nr:response regulator [FCB group bacterium]